MKIARILIAKPGLDGHDRGAKVVAHALREAGCEVIYTGIRNTPEQIVLAGIDEDVDVIGLSCLSGAHLRLFMKVTELLKEKNARDIAVIGGGVIPYNNIATLKAAGIKEVFTPGTPLSAITDWIKNNIRVRDGIP
jgi:methylmalonyl-CoA mutase C-terminal domain/subunit